ncbi:hypothetical protein AB79_3267 [Escherichia coli 6-175-07_S1_C3]|nr:hypothetical protein AB50_2931 [Escherichia coli 6-175-07_S1_C2]KEM52357.1 hypothetical protein AB79_3267 [Escherichia coli 6-175-07_S1_C3]
MSKLIVPQWPLPKGVAACSSTRIGGVSLPPYDSLNLGAHCGDNPDHVEENRKRLFAAGNLPSKPVWLEQVHGRDVLKLTGEPYASKRADASYSNTPGTVCAVMTADCLPVLFCNRAGTEVAAAHAGWRGLCAGVLEETVSCFADNPENILAWLGPAIGPRAFEVGAEVREAFMAVDAKAVQLSFSMVISIWRIFLSLPGSVWRTSVSNKFSAATVVHIRKMRLSSLIVATRPPVVWQVSFG